MKMLFLLIALLWSAPALGEEPPLCSAAHALQYGDVVPCREGVLFPPAWALEATRLKTVSLPRCENALRLATAEAGADHAAWEEQLASCEDYSRSQDALLDKALALSTPETPWYRSPWLWGTGGVILGAAVGGAVAWVVTR